MIINFSKIIEEFQKTVKNFSTLPEEEKEKIRKEIFVSYRDEDFFIWNEYSIKLGLLATVDDKSFKELENSLSDSKNIHRRRHGHMALPIYFAHLTKNEKNIKIISKSKTNLFKIKNYILDLLIKSSDNIWLDSSLLITIGYLFSKKKLPIEDFLEIFDGNGKKSIIKSNDFSILINSNYIFQILINSNSIDSKTLFTLFEKLLKKFIKIEFKKIDLLHFNNAILLFSHNIDKFEKEEKIKFDFNKYFSENNNKLTYMILSLLENKYISLTKTKQSISQNYLPPSKLFSLYLDFSRETSINKFEKLKLSLEKIILDKNKYELLENFEKVELNYLINEIYSYELSFIKNRKKSSKIRKHFSLLLKELIETENSNSKIICRFMKFFYIKEIKFLKKQLQNKKKTEVETLTVKFLKIAEEQILSLIHIGNFKNLSPLISKDISTIFIYNIEFIMEYGNNNLLFSNFYKILYSNSTPLLYREMSAFSRNENLKQILNNILLELFFLNEENHKTIKFNEIDPLFNLINIGSFSSINRESIFKLFEIKLTIDYIITNKIYNLNILDSMTSLIKAEIIDKANDFLEIYELILENNKKLKTIKKLEDKNVILKDIIRDINKIESLILEYFPPNLVGYLIYMIDIKYLTNFKKEFSTSKEFLYLLNSGDEQKLYEYISSNKEENRINTAIEFSKNKYNYLLEDDLKKLNNSGNSFIKFPTLFYSIGFGYLTPFITGGNGDMWNFITNSNYLSLLFFSIFSISLVYYKIFSTINKIVTGNNSLYKNLSIKKRTFRFFSAGFLYSLTISTLGLFIFYDPKLFSNLTDDNFKINLLLNYFLFVPSLSLFIGTFIEKRD